VIAEREAPVEDLAHGTVFSVEQDDERAAAERVDDVAAGRVALAEPRER
jgi:hypothetical protein